MDTRPNSPKVIRKRLKSIRMTPTRIRVYHYIEGYIRENECGPTYEEIGRFLGSKSINPRARGQAYVDLLIRAGYLTMGRRPNNRMGRNTGSLRLTKKRPDWYEPLPEVTPGALDEATAYEWSAECLRKLKIGKRVEAHILQQVADKVASAILEASRRTPRQETASSDAG